MTRLWRKAQPISVQTNGRNEPIAFIWRGRRHGVETITRQWRTDVEWWRERVWRSSYKLVTNTGLLVVVYQDLLSGDWYLQRLYD
jgi:hypothetical protein